MKKAGRHALVKDGRTVFYMKMVSDVLMIDRVQHRREHAFVELVMAAIADNIPDDCAYQRVTLMEFHNRFGHLAYETIEFWRMILNQE